MTTFAGHPATQRQPASRAAQPGGGEDVSLRLVRAPAAAAQAPEQLDESQQAVVEVRRGSGPMVVVGAPGTGKTTTLIEAVAARVLRDGLSPSSVLLLAPTRRAAAGLRERLTARLAAAGTPAMLEPPARTAASYAFSLIRRASVLSGEPTPRLISGPEQDVILADLLAGHAEGEGHPPPWPDEVAQAVPLRGFRHELRDLLMRAMERGIGPDELDRLGRRHRRAGWRAAAVVYREYLQVTALATPGAYDPAAIVDHAASLLAHDPELLEAERARLRLVAVDDHHESGEALARLLDQLAPGADLILTGDPDATTQAFRGALPKLLAEAPIRYPRLDGDPAPVFVLAQGHRQGEVLAATARRVVERIGALGPAVAARRAGQPSGPEGRVEVAILRSSGAQAARIAALLRHSHVLEEVPWSRMAVVARDSGQVAGLRRALSQADVPVSFSASDVALRDEAAVRPLLAVTSVLLGERSLDDPDVVSDLLSSVGRADSLGVRRVRRRLRHALATHLPSGSMGTDELLALLLAEPDRVPDQLARHIDAGPHAENDLAPLIRTCDVLAAGREVLARPDATAESLLWAVWQATGFAEAWRSQALAGGPGGRRADHDLDAVVALFEAAARFADRLPWAGAMEFLTRLGAQELPEDSLAPHAPHTEAVTVTTVQGVAGREFDVVAVAGLQDGQWPNTRLRGSLLGSTALVDVVAGRDLGDGGDARRDERARVAALRAARTEVLHDELRMLLVALTRARRTLLVTAVSNADTVPSTFIDLIDPTDGPEPRPVQPAPHSVSLASVVARLRAVLNDPSATATARAEAAEHLHRLAEQAVPGAAPADWYGWAGPSDDRELRSPSQPPVTVSPSAIEQFDACALRWLLDRSGGAPPAPATVAVGNLVHALAYELPEASATQLQAQLQARWAEVGLPSGWVSDQLLARAEAMLERLVAYRGRHQRQVVGREVDFRVRIGEAIIAGRIDQLELDDQGRLVAVDFKTGSRAPTAAELESNAQLGAYQLAIAQGGFGEVSRTPRVAGGGVLVQLGAKTQSVKVQSQPPLPAEPENWAGELVARVAEGMGGREFAATPNPGCRHCPVRSSCPAQAEGGQLRR
ncbi:MAG: ATP-dependent helicase [Actinomycetales bacterium]